MTAEESDRNGLLREALQAPAGCPAPADLVEAALAAAPTPAAEALLAHAATCPFCSAELALVGAFEGAPRSADEAQEIAWVAGRLSLPGAGRPSELPPGVATASPASLPAPQMARVLRMDAASARRSRRPRAASLSGRWAAAALVVVGLGFFFQWARETMHGAGGVPGLPEAPAMDVVRSGEIQLESPIGILAAAPAELSWRAIAGAASYRVEVRDVAGDLVWQGDSAKTRLAVPAELAAKLETLVTYRWTVTAFDAAASALAHSAPTGFRIEPKS